MLRNYLKVAFRQLFKHKGFSLINILGLAVGMASCVLIGLFVRDELGYDRFHERGERIYRVATTLTPKDQPPNDYAITTPALGPTLLAEVPEIAGAARLLAYFEAAAPGRAAVWHGESRFSERFFWAEPSFLEIFSFPLVEGDAQRALTNPGSVIVTEEAARRYFADGQAMGRSLRIDTGYSEEEYMVTGVMRDLPGNSHIHFDLLLPFANAERIQDPRVALDNWFEIDSYLYVELAEGASPAAVDEKLDELIVSHMGERWPKHFDFFLVPLSDIHLRSHMLDEIEPNGDIVHVYILTVVAFLILLIACINFTNLTTARSADRAREVGMRKAVGAHRLQLVGQFFLESTVVASIAMLIGLALALLFLPRFSDFIGRPIHLGLESASWLLGITFLGAVLAGAYPALVLSSFQPVEVLGGTPGRGPKRRAHFRRAMVVVQFSLSIILIIGAFVIFDQLNHMRRWDMGFESESVVILRVRDHSFKERHAEVKERIEQIPNVLDTAVSALTMGDEAPMILSKAISSGNTQLLSAIVADPDWPQFYGLELLHGRSFTPGAGEINLHSFLLTESGARALGWADPARAVGERMIWGGDYREGEVIGVVKDFNYRPLRFSIHPAVILLRPIAYHFLSVKIGPGPISETLESIQEAWSEVFPNRTYDYFFLDDRLEQMYRSDERLGQAVSFFSFMAVILACLGLLGLASFAAEQRTREFGIRKALGAGTRTIVALLANEFFQLILIATVIAWPLVFFAMRRWLESFAYRTPLHVGYFVLGGLLALLIAALTVSFHSVRAAYTNPSNALRYE